MLHHSSWTRRPNKASRCQTRNRLIGSKKRKRQGIQDGWTCRHHFASATSQSPNGAKKGRHNLPETEQTSEPEKSAFYFASKQMETRVQHFGKITALYCFQGHESGLKPEKSRKYSSVHIAYKKHTWGVKVKPCGVQKRYWNEALPRDANEDY